MNAQAQHVNAEEVIANEQDYVLGVYSRPPFVIERGEGSTLYDSDGNAYIDYVLAQGPMILGHSHPAVLDTVNTAMRKGQLFAGQHEWEILLAQKMVEIVPSAEMASAVA